MIRQRLMAVVAGSALAAGGTAVAAHAALAGDTGDHGGNQPETGAVPATPQQETQTVPGVGTVTFTVDPTTEAITNVMVMPVTGVTAGTPVIGDKEISIPITLADGTVQTLRVKIDIEHDHTVVRVQTQLKNEPEIDAVEVERPEAPDVEAPEAAEAPEGPEVEHPETPNVENHNGENAGDGHDGQTATTTPSRGDHSGSDQSGGSGDGGSGGHDGGSDGGGH